MQSRCALTLVHTPEIEHSRGPSHTSAVRCSQGVLTLTTAVSSPLPFPLLQADVWACAVLLFVMLFGQFPYDHSEHPDPNSSDAHAEVSSHGVASRAPRLGRAPRLQQQ